MEGEIFIFEPIIDEVGRRNAFCQKGANLIEHTRLKARMETLGDALAPQIAGNIDSEVHTGQGREGAMAEGRLLKIVGLDLNGADGALGSIDIGGVVHRGRVFLLQFHEHFCQFAE